MIRIKAALLVFLEIAFQAACPAASPGELLRVKVASICPDMFESCVPDRPISKNIEQPPRTIPRILVPNGTKNLSKGRPVTSSDKFQIRGDLSFVTDDKKELGGDGVLLLLDGLQWVQIDLGQECEISVIWIWHDYLLWGKCLSVVYNDVIVQISNNENFGDGTVTTVFNNDANGSSRMGKGRDKQYVESPIGKPIALKEPVKRRYVRLYSAGNNFYPDNSYVEVEVYGLKL